ncbi:MAG: exopolysaccharide biosynthesis polyprenyl glycosylphosphotransferase [Tepidisphaeraceae bacterium]
MSAAQAALSISPHEPSLLDPQASPFPAAEAFRIRPDSTVDRGAPDRGAPARDDFDAFPVRNALPATWASAKRSLVTVGSFLASDAIALMGIALIADAVCSHIYPAGAFPTGWAAVFGLLPLLIAYAIYGLYTETWLHPVVESRWLSKVTTVAMLGMALCAFLSRPMAVWLMLAWLPAVVLVPLFRTITRFICLRCRSWGYPTLVVELGATGGAETVNLLLRTPRSGLRPVLLTNADGLHRDSSVAGISDPTHCASLIRAYGIRHAVIAMSGPPSPRKFALLDRYTAIVPHVLILADTGTMPCLWGVWRNGWSISGAELRNSLLQRELQAAKRAIDAATAAVILLLTAPLILACGLLTRLHDGGPMFFGHQRIGLDGHPFNAWKLRTMHSDSDRLLQRHLEEHPEARDEWERDRKLRRDPRVTPLGNLLRRTSIDELPQLWNVLRGDMSLVGPRPIVADEISRYGAVFGLYTRVRPGITGLWQVSGRNDVTYRDRVTLDQFYIRHWSLWLDLYILARTAYVLLLNRGAY